MRKIVSFLCVPGMFFVMISGFVLHAEQAEESGSVTQPLSDKEKSEALFANDLGPAEVDVSIYPADMVKRYKLMLKKCSRCHGPSRILNSPFLELKLDKEKGIDEIAEFKKSEPEIFQDKHVWQIEDNIWQRYVKRMMTKRGSMISKEEGKEIWKFLAYDSKIRKTGENAKKWAEQRRKLLDEFKKLKPERHEELYGKRKK